MKHKQLIAVLLALLTAAALLAGCEKDVANLGAEDVTTTPVLTPEALADAMHGIGVGDDYGELTDEQRAALQAQLQSGGFLPAGVTLPAVGATAPGGTTAPTMPTGVAVQPSEVYPLVKAVQDTFNSGTFYLKGSGSSPLGGVNSSQMVIAVDKNKFVMQTDMDWLALAKASDSTNIGMATIQGSIMQTSLGRKFSMISSDEGVYFAFPDKKSYVDMKSLMQGGDTADAVENPVSGMSEMFGGESDIPKNIPSSRVTLNGKNYLCATFNDDDGKPLMRYFFLNGELKRIEAYAETDEEGQDGNMVLEIEEFSGKVDPKLFSVAGYREMPLTEIMKVMGGLDSLGSLGGLVGS